MNKLEEKVHFQFVHKDISRKKHDTKAARIKDLILNIEIIESVFGFINMLDKFDLECNEMIEVKVMSYNSRAIA